MIEFRHTTNIIARHVILVDDVSHGHITEQGDGLFEAQIWIDGKTLALCRTYGSMESAQRAVREHFGEEAFDGFTEINIAAA